MWLNPNEGVLFDETGLHIQDIAKGAIRIVIQIESIGTHGILLGICIYLHFRKYKRFVGL